MKTKILPLILICLAINNFIKANDTIPPVITMNGAPVVYHILNSAYTDPGATAVDNVDGNVSSGITSSANSFNPDVNLTGTYTIIYSVSDIAGNIATATRIIYVYNEAEFLGCSNYTGNDTCSVSTPFFYSGGITVSNTINRRFIIINFGGFGNTIFVNADLMGITVGSAITCPPSQNLGGSATLISGNGTIVSLSPVTFSIIYNWSDGTNSESCLSNYVTQCFTGISEEKSGQSLLIYPNPSNGVFKVSGNSSQIINVFVYNLQSELIYSKQLNSSEGEIDLSNQPDGIYFIRLNTMNGSETKRVIINK